MPDRDYRLKGDKMNNKEKILYRKFYNGKLITDEFLKEVTPFTAQKDYPKNSFQTLIKLGIVEIPEEDRIPSPAYIAILTNDFKDFLNKEKVSLEDDIPFSMLVDLIKMYINTYNKKSPLFSGKKLIYGMAGLLCFIIDTKGKGEVWTN